MGGLLPPAERHSSVLVAAYVALSLILLTNALAWWKTDRYGLLPPDHGGIYGPGETMTYAAQRLLTRHSLAREFSRNQISNPPFANENPLHLVFPSSATRCGLPLGDTNVDSLIGAVLEAKIRARSG